MLLAEKCKCDQKWNTIFYINWDFETQILLDLIASSKAKGQLYQEPNNVSRISYSPYPLIFEQIELIGCVKNCVASSQECVKQLVCAQFLKLVSAAQGAGALNCRGKQTFCCTLSWFILLLKFWNGQFQRKRMWKLCNFTQRGVKLHKYGRVSIAVNQVNRDAIRLWMGRWSLSPGQTGSSVTYQRRITPPMTPCDHHYWPIAATPFFS